MKRFLSLLPLLAALPLTAFAHKTWLLPSQTIAGGEAPWVTVDAAVSNDLFYFNHAPLRLEMLSITAPDGSRVQPQNALTGKYRSVFDLQLIQHGTYKLTVLNSVLFATWQEAGQPKRWRGNVADFASTVPEHAQDLHISQLLARVDTFITHGAPSQTALEPSGQGIELIALTHPNDLFAGEKAQFKLQVDGQPAAGLNVQIVRGGTRYRNTQEEINVTSNAQGEFSVTWPEAGMYLLETSCEDRKTTFPQAKLRRLSYMATLEVLPQ